jgi:hypothetical protein
MARKTLRASQGSSVATRDAARIVKARNRPRSTIAERVIAAALGH